MTATRRRTLEILGAAGTAALGLSALSGRAAAAESTTGTPVEFLGAFHRESRATGINARGQIVGESAIRPGEFRTHAFRWSDGALRDLGTLGGDSSAALGVNDRGQIVGESATSGNHASRAFLWESGEMRDIGTLGGLSDARAVNDRGRVVGSSMAYVNCPEAHRICPEVHAFAWRNGTMRDLGTLGGRSSRAFDVDTHGRIVGGSEIRNDSFRAFLWEDGEMRNLGTLGGDHSRALAINDRGQVVGESRTESDNQHAFLWEDGKMRDLGSLGGYSTALDINDRGRIVGGSQIGGCYHACLWEDGRIRDLGTLSEADDVSRAEAVNDRGWIVGSSGRRSLRAVLWKP